MTHFCLVTAVTASRWKSSAETVSFDHGTVCLLAQSWSLTCDLDQLGCTLHPAPRVIIAVPGPAAVIPWLLWADFREDEGSSSVSEGKMRLDGLDVGIQMWLRGEDRVIQEPWDVRESSSTDMTAQPCCSQLGVSCVQIFHLHFHISSNWNWIEREEGSEGHKSHKDCRLYVKYGQDLSIWNVKPM